MPPPTRPFTGGRLAQLAVDLTTRERQFLAELATLHVATTAQLGRLVFGGCKPATTSRLGQRHAERLVRFNLIHRYANRSHDRKVGAPGYVLTLTEAGWSLSGADTAARQRQRRSWMPSDAFLAHRLAISELYVRLTEQSRDGGPTLREFKAEPDSWRRYLGLGDEPQVAKPDALVRLVANGLELSWFVEIDRGTEGQRHIADKCDAYRRFELSGVEQQRFGIFPGVVFIVPTEPRRQVVQRVIDRQTAAARGLFAVTTEAVMLTALASPIT
ncbi:replication-relaxation family protein [Streptomyces sp. NPDC054945]